MEKSPDEVTTEEVLSGPAFLSRAQSEVSRVYRMGGFLSIVVLDWSALDGGATRAWVSGAGARIRRGVRAHDSVGRVAPLRLAIVTPATTQAEAAIAARRALAMIAPDSPLPSVGVASSCGAVEGGAEALLEEAAAVAAATGPGGVGLSPNLAGRPRVLVVDDDAAFASALADTITELGWEAHPCTVAVDADARVQEPGYQGLFLDVVMPERPGTVVFENAMRAFPRRPVVVMSGEDLTGDLIVSLLSRGPTTFIRKPLSRADVASALEMFRGLLPGGRVRGGR